MIFVSTMSIMLQKMLDTQKRIRTTTRVIHEEKMMGSHDLNQRGFYTSKIMFTTSFFFLSRIWACRHDNDTLFLRIVAYTYFI